MSASSRLSALEAHEPPEARGAGRDDVALLVAYRHTGTLAHGRFPDLPHFLVPGDLLVVNTSATLPAALDARLGDRPVELRLSTPADGEHWVVELRADDGGPLRPPPIGGRVELPGGGRAELTARYAGSDRLGLARLEVDRPLEEYLRLHGRADSLRLRARAVAARGVPDRLRARARQRRDAERSAAVHAGPRDRARRPRDPDRAAAAPHRRLVARARRTPVPGALPRSRDDGAARERRSPLGRARDRRRDDRRPGARDRRGDRRDRARPARAGRASS